MNRPPHPNEPDPLAVSRFDFGDLIERMNAKIADRAVEGRFAEYAGKFAFSSIGLVPPLNLGVAPQAVEGIIRDTPWGTPKASREVAGYVSLPASLLNRALLGCLDEPEAAQSDEVFGLLNGCAQDLPHNLLELPAAEGMASLQKIWLLGGGLQRVRQKESFGRRAFGDPGVSDAMREFANSLEGYMEQIGEELRASSGDSPLQIMHLLDSHYVLDDLEVEVLERKKAKYIARRHGPPRELYMLMADVHVDVGMSMVDLFYRNFTEPLAQQWECCQRAWGWPEVNQVIGAFATLQSQRTQVHAVEALEDAGEAELGDIVPAKQLAVEGLASIIHTDIYDNAGGEQYLRELTFLSEREMVNDITFGDIVLPREQVPMATIALLSDMAEKLSTDDFAAALHQMQQTIFRKRSAVATTGNEWLLTLALLRKYSGPHLGEKVNAFIDRDDFPHQPFREVIMNRQAGCVSLLNGKVRVDAKQGKSGIVLATSSFVAPVTPEASTSQGEARPSQFVAHAGVSRGNKSVRGAGPTRRQRKKAARQTQQGAEPSPPAESPTPQENARPTILFGNNERIEQASGVSAEDLALVRQALVDYQALGRHRLELLRGRAADGALRAKMRLNGQANGIRVILTHVGDNRFEVESIGYRGSAYKSLPR